MKKMIFAALFGLLAISARGQERHTLGYFRSFPVGKFGSKHLGGGAFAKSGWGFLLENNAKPKLFPKFLSFGTRFSYQKNEIDNHAMRREFSKALGYETRIGESAYEPILLLGGPHVEIGIGGKRTVQFKTGFGVMFTKVRSFRIEVLDAQNNILFDDVIDAGGNIPFAYMLGLQLRQGLTRNISINAFSEYSSAKGEMGAKLGKVRIPKSEFDIRTLSLGLALRLDF